MMKSRLCNSVLLGIFLFATAIPAWGGMVSTQPPNFTLVSQRQGDMQFSLGLTTVLENGDMSYTIKGPEEGGWKSVLEWPLDTILYLGGVGSINFLQRFQVNVGVWKPLTSDSGIMKDSDWLYGYYGNQKAIYSESDTTVNSTQFDINLRYNFFGDYAFLIGGMLGYSRTSWDWETRDGYQWSIDPGEYYHGPLDGLGVIYTQDLDVPYLGLIMSMFSANGALGFNGYALYSPIARCQDEDEHVLRAKLSQGDSRGSYWGLGADLRWDFAARWSANGTLKYSSYNLEGEQTQYFYAGDLEGSGAKDIDLTVEGSQIYFGLGVNYDF